MAKVKMRSFVLPCVRWSLNSLLGSSRRTWATHKHNTHTHTHTHSQRGDGGGGGKGGRGGRWFQMTEDPFDSSSSSSFSCSPSRFLCLVPCVSMRPCYWPFGAGCCFLLPPFFISCIVIDSYDALISTWPRTNQPTNQQTNNIETFFQHNQREIRVRQNSSSSSSSSFLCIFKIIIRKDWPLHPVTWPDTWRTQQNKFKIDDGEERNEKRKRKGDNWFKDTRSVGEKCVRLFVWENPGAAWLDVRTSHAIGICRTSRGDDRLCAHAHTHFK